MSTISNQDIERHYFEHFRKAYSLPTGVIRYSDSPDVIIEGDRRIGIEITNFYIEKGELSESRQVQGKFRKEVLSKAQQVYLNNSAKNIEISFGFNEAQPIRNKTSLIDRIVDLAKHIEEFKTGEITKGVYRSIPELSFVYLNDKEYEKPEWRVVQVYDTPLLSRNRLAEIVIEKEKRAKKYQNCHEYWLLVVVDFINSSQDQEIQIEGFEKIQSNIFKKVIVFKTLFNHILEAT
ncbi:MAG: hypothetical protein H8E10_19600 [Desulfobacterales bacterium]|jgi:hypothetical protein|nr:hypothetical protein [Desulfobacterales bacterium]MBL7173418.1 hypothetical protein [Desulfobacteraceae bacterium]